MHIDVCGLYIINFFSFLFNRDLQEHQEKMD